jgi:hypothetical protein
MHRYFVIYENVSFDNHKESQIIDVDFAVVDNRTLRFLMYKICDQPGTMTYCILDFKELPIEE